MANAVKLLDLSFESQKAAEEYFYNIRDEYWKSKQVIRDSVIFEQLKALYEQYCKETNWPMPGTPVSFRVKNNHRGQGSSGGTTQGFAVTFDNGEEKEFSAEKAIQAIAKKRNNTQTPNEALMSAEQILESLFTENNKVLLRELVKRLKTFKDYSGVTLEIIEACKIANKTALSAFKKCVKEKIKPVPIKLR